ncbi:hypothetical protein HMPREF3037_01618 [Candidatus Stoquefichus sp. KLE1796]|nr:hypothetical protein HMPREF3037_01618 [Candidatus Stoquefichus sp. KLE1796]
MLCSFAKNIITYSFCAYKFLLTLKNKWVSFNYGKEKVGIIC